MDETTEKRAPYTILMADHIEGYVMLHTEEIEDIAEQKQVEIEVISFADGRDALIYLQFHHVDLNMVELMLPGTNGVEFCRKCKQQYSTIPIILMTYLRGRNGAHHHAYLCDVFVHKEPYFTKIMNEVKRFLFTE